MGTDIIGNVKKTALFVHGGFPYLEDFSNWILMCLPWTEDFAVTEFGLVQSPKMNVNPINQSGLS